MIKVYSGEMFTEHCEAHPHGGTEVEAPFVRTLEVTCCSGDPAIVTLFVCNDCRLELEADQHSYARLWSGVTYYGEKIKRGQPLNSD